MELFMEESVKESHNHTVKQQRAIPENFKLQALHNFQIGLHYMDIKLLFNHSDIEFYKRNLLI